ncbi:MAG: glycoside hydrolase family 127 protein [Verrucomicrobia bacterium]|jgi:uncharacterized protein|nr:glycoside hydrolase family 127 protein [Verrucomicrobiota bacterium]MBT7068204.1 glycoside hydrolase family 127 protein [Verrucomicrobiota bacterium]MBT7700941.1 glycoside hydrolase family 127 protein [Verrucomicrobiota bacterium]
MTTKAVTKRQPVQFQHVTIKDGFWGKRIQTNRDVTMPIQYQQLKTTGRIDAMALKWKPGKPNKPHIFWDSDVAKWLEAAAYTLTAEPDAKLEKQVDTIVATLEKAQAEDGYLNSYYRTVEPDKRWTNLRDNHELYCSGHLMEAAVAYFRATGKRAFLDVMCRNADHIGRVFGPRRGQKRGYPGHQEIELALVKLFDVTGNEDYLELARFFVDERGRKDGDYFKKEARARGQAPAAYAHGTPTYNQAHAPVREQTKVVGHAVRAMYLYCGMADVAASTGDKTLLKACKRLWHNATQERMHVTGGIGPTAANEGFTMDYDLPTEGAYLETCAAIGLVFWAHRMLQAELDGNYGDVMELALYNGVISGVSQEGDHFFYGNPLAVHPEMNGTRHQGPDYHYRRSEWFGCACCPPNVARLLASLGSYIYSSTRSELSVHLYINGQAEVELAGQPVTVVQNTAYPDKDTVRLTVSPAKPAAFTVALRIPAWCRKPALQVNGKAVAIGPITRKGYARIKRTWQASDKVLLTLPMPVERIVAPPQARQTCGRVALKRGPVVYCLEEVDNGKALNDIRLPRDAKLTAAMDRSLFDGTVVVRGAAVRRKAGRSKAALYSSEAPAFEKARITAIPYSLWAHRAAGEMQVWVRE